MRAKIQVAAALGLLIMGMSQSVRATSYQFSFQFSAGPLVTGSFDGVQSGDDVNGIVTAISNVSVFENGSPFNGNGGLFANSLDSTGYIFQSGGAVASYSVFGNNFIFIDCDLNANACPFTNFFLSVPLGPDHETGDVQNVADSSNDSSYATRWSLRRVPEPGTLALLGFGLAGLGLSRRRKM